MSYKSEAHASRSHKHSAMGLGSKRGGKSLDVAPGHTWDGEAGLSSEPKEDQPQRIPTRKHGGKVEGHHAKKRMDRAARKKGGRVCKADGGEAAAENTARHNREKKADEQKSTQERMLASVRGPDFEPRKSGGRVHTDEAQDMALIKREVKPAALKRDARASGGKVGKGKTNITIVVAPGAGGAQGQQAPQKVPVPVPVPQSPPPGAGAPPPGGMAMPAGGPAMGGMPPAPMMARAKGGRVSMTAGSRSGPGRMQKAKMQEKFGG